jgi:MFS family permease
MNTRLPLRLPSLRDFGRDARLLILISGWTATSFFGVFSLLRTLYVLRLGYGPVYVGAYLSSGALTFMVMGVPSGWLGERFGTRRVMLVGAWVWIIGMGLLSLTELLQPPLRDLWPFVSQIVLTLGWSAIQVNTVPALMAVTHDFNRSSAYALTSALRGMGTFAGTLAGGALPGLLAFLFGLDRTLESPTPYGLALLLGSALGLIAIVSLAKIEGGAAAPPDRAAVLQRGPFPLVPVAVMILYVYLRHTGWSTCQAFCNPYIDTELALPTSALGLLTSAGQLAAIGATLMIPRLAERWNHGWIIAGSTALLAGSLALLAFVPHWSAAGMGLLGVQVSAALWLPALQVFQMELVTEGWRGLSYGAITTAMGFGYGSMSLVGGYVIEAQGYGTLFATGIGLALAGTVVMVVISQRQQARLAPLVEVAD